MLKYAESTELTCAFKTSSWSLPGYTGPLLKNLFICGVATANLINENDTVTFNAASCSMALYVEAIYFGTGSGSAKFIPNSVFTTFPKLRVFVYNGGQSLDILKPEYFRNATNLKVLDIEKNDIENLGANLFVHAANLELIDLSNNKIANIHKLTFDGLYKLERLYLNNNPISNLHPDTFKPLVSLKSLNLLSNSSCINKKFDNNASSKSREIQLEVSKSCSNSFYQDELKVELTALEEKIKSLGVNLIAKINLLEIKLQDVDKKCFEEMAKNEEHVQNTEQSVI